MKRVIFTFLSVFSLAVMVAAANINSITNVQVIPAAPGPGQTVDVSWDYNISSEYNNPHALVVVSDQSTLRQAATNGQWVMIGNSCVTPGDPASAQVTGGCSLGNNVGPAGGGTVSSGTYSFTLPDDLIPGYTYYIIIGMKDYNVYMNPSVSVDAQNYFSFTIPLPPPTVTLEKIAEGSAGLPGGIVLYTVQYYATNTNSVVITDDVPADVTFIEAYDGGAESAGTITWNLGSFTSPVRGTVSWLGQLGGGLSDGDVIHNTARGDSSDITNSQSNDALVTIGSALNIEKIAEPQNVAVGETITYTLSFTNEGYALDEYVDFDAPADLTGWSEVVAGASWVVVGGELVGDGPGGQWGKIVKDSPSLHDAMYITDIFIPSSNSSGDAVFMFNFIDQDNQYHARIQSDANNICFDRVVATTWQQVQCVTPSGFSILTDKWYKMKVQVNSSTMRVKVWPKGDPEPTAWAIERTDTSHPGPGRPGYQDNEGEDRFDNLKIFQPAPATNLRVWDTLPACTTFAGCSGGCTESGGVVTWNFPGVIGNEYYGLDFYVIADACASNTTVHNTGCADADEPAPPVCSNDAPVVVGILDSPTSTVTPTYTETPTYTYTCTNTYTYTYTDTPTPSATLTVTETSPYTPSVTETATPSATPTFTDTATPTVTPPFTNTVTPTVTPSHTDTPVFTPTVTPTITVTFTFTQTPTATPTVTMTSTPLPAQISVSMTVMDASVPPGEYSEIRVRIVNTGTVDAEGVVVGNSVPALTTFDETYGDNPLWAFDGVNFTRVIGTVVAGSTVEVYFSLKVDEGLENEIITVAGTTVDYHEYPAPMPVTVLTETTNEDYIFVGEIVVYPNPYNPMLAVNGTLKFDNIPSGALITVHTISGERVKAFNRSGRVEWDGTNYSGVEVSAGIYYFIIRWNDGESVKIGKIYIVRP